MPSGFRIRSLVLFGPATNEIRSSMIGPSRPGVNELILDFSTSVKKIFKNKNYLIILVKF